MCVCGVSGVVMATFFSVIVATLLLMFSCLLLLLLLLLAYSSQSTKASEGQARGSSRARSTSSRSVRAVGWVMMTVVDAWLMIG